MHSKSCKYCDIDLTEESFYMIDGLYVCLYCLTLLQESKITGIDAYIDRSEDEDE